MKIFSKFKSVLFLLCFGMALGMIGGPISRDKMPAKEDNIIYADETPAPTGDSYTFTFEHFTSLTGELASKEDASVKLSYNWHRTAKTYYYETEVQKDGDVLMTKGNPGSTFYFDGIPSGYYFTSISYTVEGGPLGSAPFKFVGLDEAHNTEAMKFNPTSDSSYYKDIEWISTTNGVIQSKTIDLKLKQYYLAIVITSSNNSNPGHNFQIKSLSYTIEKIPEIKAPRLFFNLDHTYFDTYIDPQPMYNAETVTVKPEDPTLSSYYGRPSTPDYSSDVYHYRFKGWYTAASGGTEYVFGSHIEEDTTIYAQFDRNPHHTIYYRLGNFTVNEIPAFNYSRITKYYNDEAASVEFINVTIKNHNFLGWGLTEDAKTPITAADLPSTGTGYIYLYPIATLIPTSFNSVTTQAKLGFSYHYSTETIEENTTTTYSNFSNITLQFKYDTIITRRAVEHGMVITLNNDDAEIARTGSAASLPENGLSFKSTDTSKSSYVVSLKDIPLTSSSTNIYVFGYIKDGDNYYFSQVKTYTLESMIDAYLAMNDIKGTETAKIITALKAACLGE